MVITPKGKLIHFGDRNMEQYKDTTGLNKYSHLNHYDEVRRHKYLSRARPIKNKKGELTYLDKESPNYYSMRYLWSY